MFRSERKPASFDRPFLPAVPGQGKGRFCLSIRTGRPDTLTLSPQPESSYGKRGIFYVICKQFKTHCTAYGYAGHVGRDRSRNLSDSACRGDVSDGASDQHHCLRIDGTLVFASVRCYDRRDPHALYGNPPLALTGAVFGAFLSGVLYRVSGGKLIFAWLGEIIGTGIIGAIVSYPVMTYLVGRTGLTWMFYVPSFIGGTLIGGAIAYVFLKALSRSHMLGQIQSALGVKVYDRKND